MVSTVVVVEDDQDFRELVALALGSEGFRVETFATEREALAFVDRNATCIRGMVADASLEVGDGLSVCRRLRELNPKARVVVLTGDDMLLDEARRDGYIGFLKPTQLSALARALRGSR